MNTQTLMAYAALLLLGAVTSFLAIFAWARTRTPSRLCTALGVVSLYGALVYRFVLLLYGIHGGALMSVTSQTLFELLTAALSFLFFLASGIFALIRNEH